MSAGEACAENIGPRGIRMRQVVGVVAGLFGVALVAAIIAYGMPRSWRFLAFAPFWISALGFFQAREKTCVSLARRDLKDLDGGAVPVTDEAERSALRAQASRVRLLSMAVALALATAAYFLP